MQQSGGKEQRTWAPDPVKLILVHKRHRSACRCMLLRRRLIPGQLLQSATGLLLQQLLLQQLLLHRGFMAPRCALLLSLLLLLLLRTAARLVAWLRRRAVEIGSRHGCPRVRLGGLLG